MGLLHYRERWYDPQQGRFLSEDPIGFAGGRNLYEYVSGSPQNYTDPSGEHPALALLAIGGNMLASMVIPQWMGPCYGWRDVLIDLGMVGQARPIRATVVAIGQGRKNF